MRFSRSGALAAALLLTLGAGACSSKSTTASTTTTAGGGVTTTAGGGSATTAPAGAANTIDIQSFSFKVGSASYKAGSTITVTNLDNTDHSLTANDGSFDTGIFSSGSKTITLSKAGTYSIHCRIHSFMSGTITVTP
jgi:plastocyanin